MPTALPALANLEGAGPTPDSDTFRLAIGDIRRFLAGLLGTTGDPVDARAALGVPIQAGDVLQMVLATGSDGNTTATSLTAISSPAAVTPRSAASKFLVECTFRSRNIADLTAGGSYQLFEGAGAISTAFDHVNTGLDSAPAADAVGTHITVTLQAVVTNAARTARSFVLKASSLTGSIPIYYTSIVWKFTEIKT